MTGMMEKIYEETYRGYAIAIVECSSSAPGGPVHYWHTFHIRPVDSQEVSDELYCSPPEQYAAILAEARAYCDREIEESNKLPLKLSYREAKNLQRALQRAEVQDRGPLLGLRQKLQSLLE